MSVLLDHKVSFIMCSAEPSMFSSYRLEIGPLVPLQACWLADGEFVADEPLRISESPEGGKCCIFAGKFPI